MTDITKRGEDLMYISKQNVAQLLSIAVGIGILIFCIAKKYTIPAIAPVVEKKQLAEIDSEYKPYLHVSASQGLTTP